MYLHCEGPIRFFFYVSSYTPTPPFVLLDYFFPHTNGTCVTSVTSFLKKYTPSDISVNQKFSVLFKFGRSLNSSLYDRSRLQRKKIIK